MASLSTFSAAIKTYSYTQSGPQPELDIKFAAISFANRLNQNIGLTAKGLSPRQVNNSPALQDHARDAESSKHYYENQPWDGKNGLIETIYLPDSMYRYQDTVDFPSVVCKGYACLQCSGTCGLSLSL